MSGTTANIQPHSVVKRGACPRPYFLKALLSGLFLLLYTFAAHAQELRFERYTMREGLSHPGTYYRESILQDKEGFLWISTLNGLNRFDGRTFKVFQFDEAAPNSLSSNLTTGLCEAEDGKIWVGAPNGINIFDPQLETFELLRADPADPYSLCGDGVNFIRRDQDGNMWIGTQQSGICRYSIRTGHFDNFGGFFKDGLVFYQQKNGAIWLGNSDGLFRYLPEKNSFQNIAIPRAPNDPQMQAAADICELKNGNLLVASTSSGLWEFNPQDQSFKDISAGFQSDLLGSPSCTLCDREGNAWLGGVGELFQYQPGSGTFRAFRHDEEAPSSLPPLTITDAYQDRAGSLWFHTIGEGLRVAHTVDNPFKTIGDFSVSQALHLDREQVLMNTDRGLKIFDLQREALIAADLPQPLPNIRRRSMALSADKQSLYLRTPHTDEIHRYDLKTQAGTLLRPKGWLRSDPKGRPWIKLNYWDTQKNEWIDLRPTLEAAFSQLTDTRLFDDEIYFNDSSTVWIKTKQGVLHYNMDRRTGRHYPLYPGDSTATVEIHAIYPGSAGRFYCYTSNGLSVFEPKKEAFVHYGEKNGLLHNQAHAIVEDARGGAWIGSPKGLQRLDPATGTFTNYGISDGLPGETILHQSPFRDNRGFLYFSIAGQLIRFHPDTLRAKDHAPPVYLLDFYLNHAAVSSIGRDSMLPRQLRFCQEINLTHRQVDFGFSFVMPVFYKARETAYFYQLAPYEKEWKSAGQNTQIHYTNMDPGRYTFRVKARTAAGFWSPNEATIDLVIRPPWWKTNGAYLTYLLLLLAGLYGFYRSNLRRQMMKVETIRLKELNRLKSSLYTNITHEFRTPLTVIMGMTDQIRGHDRERELITRNGKNLLRLIDQLLDLSKLESGNLKLDKIQGDIVQYLQYLTESFYSMAEEKEVRLAFYPEVRERIMDYDEAKIQHIVYNLLANAIKFTPAGGKVVFHLSEIEKNQTNWLRMKVSDTGVGISEQNLPKIFDRFFQGDQSSTRGEAGTGIGLTLTKELVEMMGGRIAVKSELGEGTDVLILLPIVAGPETLRQKSTPATSLREEEHPADAPADSLVPSPVWQAFNEHAETPSLLLVEDNRDVIAYIESLLGKDYRIEMARNGRKGIEKALAMIPDIIISDVMMPEKNGYEVCQTLKKDERTSHIPIILLTARATSADRIEGLKGGADAYLTKPFNKEELFIRLEKLVAIRKALRKRYTKRRLFAGATTEGAQPSPDERFLQKLIRIVQNHLAAPTFTVSDLCEAARLSNTQVNRKLKALTGKTPSQFMRSIRLQKALELLQTTDLNISEIAYRVGFNDPSYFSRSFSEEFGRPPNAIRR